MMNNSVNDSNLIYSRVYIFWQNFIINIILKPDVDESDSTLYDDADLILSYELNVAKTMANFHYLNKHAL